MTPRLALSWKVACVPWIGAFFMGCSTHSEGASSGDAGQEGGSAVVYTPQGCDYSYSPPLRLGLQDVALDDDGPVDPQKGAPERVRIGLGGAVTKGTSGYADPTTSATFTWETAESDHAAKVRIGTSTTSLSAVHTGYTWTTPGSLGGPPTYLHEVHVCGLTSGTTYSYEVGGGPAGSEVWSAAQSFTTVPAGGSITLGVFGDARDSSATWQAVHMRMRDAAVAMQLIGGDIVDTASVESLYTTWLDAIWHDPNNPSAFLTLGQQMMVPIDGNHENDLANSFADWSIPGVAGDPYSETYASFDVGSAHILLIDDEQIAGSLASGAASAEAMAQLAWVDSDLKAANADRARHPFVVVIGHRCMFSSSVHGMDDDVLAARGALVPLYDKYSVDLVVNGHDHDYERSKPVMAGSPPSGPPVVGKGTTYVVSAGAGADAYATGTAQPFTATSVAYGTGTNYIGAYSLMELSSTTLKLTAYGLRASSSTVADDDVIDTFSVTHP
jgi:acid phosphatase type 7